MSAKTAILNNNNYINQVKPLLRAAWGTRFFQRLNKTSSSRIETSAYTFDTTTLWHWTMRPLRIVLALCKSAGKSSHLSRTGNGAPDAIRGANPSTHSACDSIPTLPRWGCYLPLTPRKDDTPPRASGTEGKHAVNEHLPIPRG